MATHPTLSVIMANRNGAAHLADALACALGQTLDNLEVVFSDDGSTDDSVAIAEAVSERDGRLRILTSATAGGPAAARNRALDAARGDWIAVADSDDLMHPARFERMLRQARGLDADIVADDQVYFGAQLGQRLLQALDFAGVWHPTAREFLAAEMASPPIPVGYLKPVIRRTALGDLRYSEAMTIGEDFDLVFRLLLAGARMAVLPEAYYLYRRHSGSISHRLRPGDCEGMIRACEGYLETAPSALAPLVRERMRMHREAGDFAELVGLLKSRAFGAAAATFFRRPGLVRPLARAFGERMAARGGTQAADAVEPVVTLADGALDRDGGAAVHPVPEDAAGWTPAEVAALVAKAGHGNARLRAKGRAGLEALGYLPGWHSAELSPPVNGWTERERDRIAALPWPVALR